MHRRDCLCTKPPVFAVSQQAHLQLSPVCSVGPNGSHYALGDATLLQRLRPSRDQRARGPITRWYRSGGGAGHGACGMGGRTMRKRVKAAISTGPGEAQMAQGHNTTTETQGIASTTTRASHRREPGATGYASPRTSTTPRGSSRAHRRAALTGTNVVTARRFSESARGASARVVTSRLDCGEGAHVQLTE